MYDLRAVLEGHAAHRATSRLRPAQIEELRASCGRFEMLAAEGDLRGVVAENLYFHETIHEAAASSRLTEMVRQTIALPLVYRSFVWYSPEQFGASLHYHRQLVGAFERRRARARRGDHEAARARSSRHARRARHACRRHDGRGAASGRRVTEPGAGPLEGVRVIELGQLLAGPFTGRLLGDLGAEIIKVEPPGQPDPIRDWGKARYEGRSLWWPVQSRNKKCITLNLRHERGQELLLRPRRARRRRGRELPARDAREVEPRLRPAERGQPAPRAGACLRLRADGPVREAGRLCLRLGGDGRDPPHQRLPRPAATAHAPVARRLARRHVRRATASSPPSTGATRWAVASARSSTSR